MRKFFEIIKKKSLIFDLRRQRLPKRVKTLYILLFSSTLSSFLQKFWNLNLHISVIICSRRFSAVTATACTSLDSLSTVCRTITFCIILICCWFTDFHRRCSLTRNIMKSGCNDCNAYFIIRYIFTLYITKDNVRLITGNFCKIRYCLINFLDSDIT